MRRQWRQRAVLALDEIQPLVDLAGCWELDRPLHSISRTPSHGLVLIESGALLTRVAGSKIEAHHGDLICFPPAERSECQWVPPVVYYVIHLQFAPPPRHRLTPVLDEIGPLPVHVTLGNRFEPMRRVFETICTEITQAGAIHRLRLRAAVDEMLVLIAESADSRVSTLAHFDDWQRARLRLCCNPRTAPRVDELARHMQMSRYYFTREFKRRFGASPQSMHMHARLSAAARLLRSGVLPVKAVAAELGFADADALTRLFKRHFGVRPSDVRAGAAPGPESPGDSRGLFPMNTHLVPPETEADWIKQFEVPSEARRMAEAWRRLWGDERYGLRESSRTVAPRTRPAGGGCRE